jgi:hypothetical protein
VVTFIVPAKNTKAKRHFLFGSFSSFPTLISSTPTLDPHIFICPGHRETDLVSAVLEVNTEYFNLSFTAVIAYFALW